MASVVGKRNGMLVVLVSENRRYLVRCDCGIEKVISAGNFYRTASCGCAWKAAIGAATATHGLTRGGAEGRRRPPEYETWANMVQRCINSNRPEWHRYGGRGITVCSRWRESVEAFIADMGPRPSTRHSIDRINNNGNYEPGNCRWALKVQQARNTSTNHPVGGASSLVEAAERAGINRGTLMSRLKRGWSEDRALSVPPDTRRGKKARRGEMVKKARRK